MIAKGDRVSVLDEAIDGVVVNVQNDRISIETNDGFTMTYFVNELVKVNNTSDLSGSNVSFNLNQVLREKEIPKARSFVKEKKSKKDIGVPEFDLHIDKLVKSKGGMTNFDILNLQTETAIRHIEFAIRNRIPKIVFIHGVGEGVLKAELDFIFGRYDNVTFQDANYQKYGLGATEVYFKQNP
jgi:dsDNA-specific endonuclease/ATPase MutS2